MNGNHSFNQSDFQAGQEERHGLGDGMALMGRGDWNRPMCQQELLGTPSVSFPEWHSVQSLHHLPEGMATTATFVSQPPTYCDAQRLSIQPPQQSLSHPTTSSRSSCGHHHSWPKPSFAELGLVCDHQSAHGLDDQFMKLMNNELPALYWGLTDHHHPQDYSASHDNQHQPQHPLMSRTRIMSSGQQPQSQPLPMLQPSPELDVEPARWIVDGNYNSFNVPAAASGGNGQYFGTTAECVASTGGGTSPNLAVAAVHTGSTSLAQVPPPTQFSDTTSSSSNHNINKKKKKRKISNRSREDCPYARYNNRLASLVHQVEETKKKSPPAPTICQSSQFSTTTSSSSSSFATAEQLQGGRKRKKQPPVISASKALQRDCRKEHRMRLLQAEREEPQQTAQNSR